MSTAEDRRARREKRRAAGFRTQADLAEATGLHKSTIANYESGKLPTPKWLDLLLETCIELETLSVEFNTVANALNV